MRLTTKIVYIGLLVITHNFVFSSAPAAGAPALDLQLAQEALPRVPSPLQLAQRVHSQGGELAPAPLDLGERARSSPGRSQRSLVAQQAQQVLTPPKQPKSPPNLVYDLLGRDPDGHRLPDGKGLRRYKKS